MAENSQKQEEKLTLEAHLQFAVRAIEQDQHLRVLVRHFLATCSALPPSSVFDLNPIQNSYNQGFQAAGLEFANLLTSVEPRMVPTLMLEELTSDEQV